MPSKRAQEGSPRCCSNAREIRHRRADRNCKWTGTPLAPLLQGSRPEARGHRRRVFRAGTTGAEKAGATPINKMNFGRDLTMADALRDDVLPGLGHERQALWRIATAPPLRLVRPRLVRRGVGEIPDAHRSARPSVSESFHGSRTMSRCAAKSTATTSSGANASGQDERQIGSGQGGQARER